MLHAKDSVITLDKNTMNYISFGSGRKTLIMLPGVGDGIKTVKGCAIPFAWLYRAFAKRYKVYVLSRINELEAGYTTRDMAKDVKLAMEKLGIASASIIGVSQGGMIAQHLALDYPESIEKLVLAVTLSRQNDTLQSVVSSWIEMAKNKDYKQLMIDTAEKSYSESYLHKYRRFFPLLGLMKGPKDFSRFIIQAESCLTHNTYDRLSQIKCQTLVLAGTEDRIVGAAASKEISERISGSELHIFEGLGHAAYEEAADFNLLVLDFLDK